MSDDATIVMVITTVDHEDVAHELAAKLVEQSLGACVQIDGPITSHYRWQGQQERTREWRLMIKTSASVWPKLNESLAVMHPYDEPEIICLEINESSEGYRRWVLDSVASR